MPPESATLATIYQELQPLTSAIEQARTLAGLREGRFPVNEGLRSHDAPLAHHSQVRVIAHLLTLDALSRAGAGDIDGALVSCRAMLGAARSIGDEPRLASQLERMGIAARAVRAVERVLACGEASETTLAQVQSELAEEMRFSWVLKGLRGERAVTFDAFERIIRGEATSNSPKDGSPSSNSAGTSEPKGSGRVAFYRGCQAQLLSELNHAIRIARRPSNYQEAEWRQYLQEIEGSEYGLGALPSVWKPDSGFPSAELVVLSGRSGLWTRAYLGCAVLGLACERQRLVTGTFPESSKAIESRFLDVPPGDPYGRGSVRLSILRDGIEATSAGPSPGGSDGKNSPVSAIGFRLLKTDHRSTSIIGKDPSDPEAHP
jgi:hypothetical protein